MRRTPIDLSVGGLVDPRKEFRDLIDELRDLKGSMRDLRVSGPGSQFRQAQRQLVLARATGDELAEFDARRNFLRAQSRFREAQEGPTLQARFQEFARSTRFGGGGGLGGFMPLAGRTLDLAGAGEAAGPIGLAVAALDGFARIVRTATERLNELGNAARMSGGSAGQVAGLTTMGIPAGELAGRAARLRQLGTTDPYAIGDLSRMGIRTTPRPFGKTNEAEDLQRALEALRAMGEGEEQLRAARNLGLDDLLVYVNVSADVANQQRHIAEQTARLLSPEHVRAANDLRASWQLMQEAGANLATRIGEDFLPATKLFVQTMTESLRRWTEMIDDFAPASKGGLFGLSLRGLLPDNVVDAIVLALKLNAEAQNKNAAATNNLTRAFQEGLYGGTDLARSAIGQGMQGEFLRQGIRGATMRLGGLGV